MLLGRTLRIFVPSLDPNNILSTCEEAHLYISSQADHHGWGWLECRLQESAAPIVAGWCRAQEGLASDFHQFSFYQMAIFLM